MAIYPQMRDGAPAFTPAFQAEAFLCRVGACLVGNGGVLLVDLRLHNDFAEHVAPNPGSWGPLRLPGGVSGEHPRMALSAQG
jgi:hypothetical protein